MYHLTSSPLVIWTLSFFFEVIQQNGLEFPFSFPFRVYVISLIHSELFSGLYDCIVDVIRIFKEGIPKLVFRSYIFLVGRGEMMFTWGQIHSTWKSLDISPTLMFTVFCFDNLYFLWPRDRMFIKTKKKFFFLCRPEEWTHLTRRLLSRVSHGPSQ